jgi:hypothetical protein
MPHHQSRTITGTITHIFAHRFVVRAEHGDVLADITPKGAGQIALRINDTVTLEGEMKPSELKVTHLTRFGQTIAIDHEKKPRQDHHAPADPAIALSAAREAGFAVLGSPRRKPKHFEVLGTRRGALHELHIELDGHIRKSRPVARDDHKWAAELGLGEDGERRSSGHRHEADL